MKFQNPNKLTTELGKMSSQTVARLTGHLVLFRHPQEGSEVASKQYVDQRFQNLDAGGLMSGELAAAHLPAFSGDVVNTAGSSLLELSATGVAPGQHTKMTVDNRGRVVATEALALSDIPVFPWSKLSGGLPSTVSGYGIVDAVPLSGGTIDAAVQLTATPTNPLHAVTKGYVVSALGGGGSANVETGFIMESLTATSPSGYGRCNGGVYSKTTYSALYAEIGDQYGEGYVALGGGSFINNYYLSAAELGTPLPNSWSIGSVGTRYGAKAFLNRGYVYVIGGWGPSGGYLSEILRCAVDSNGVAGAFSSYNGSYGIGVMCLMTAQTKDRIYCLGGMTTGGNLVSGVYSAALNSDGSLGNWFPETPLPVAMYDGCAIITKNRIYVLGGYTSGSIANIYTAPINPDGSLGAWTGAGTLPAAISMAQCAVIGNKVYLVGGFKPYPTPSADVYVANINSDGTLGTWSTGPSLPQARGYAQLFVVGNQMILMGGTASGSIDSTVKSYFKTDIAADGSIGPWSQAIPLSTGPNTIGVGFTTKSRIYLTFGFDSGSYVATGTYLPYSKSGVIEPADYFNGTYSGLGVDEFRVPNYLAKETAVSFYHIKL